MGMTPDRLLHDTRVRDTRAATGRGAAAIPESHGRVAMLKRIPRHNVERAIGALRYPTVTSAAAEQATRSDLPGMPESSCATYRSCGAVD
jgi:hypothetical protein